MKIFGCLIVFIVIVYCGMEWSKSYETRVRSLRSFIDALHVIDAEMHYSKGKLIDIFLKASKQTTFPVDHFFYDLSVELEKGIHSLEYVWEAKLKELKTTLSMNNEDIAILIQFGRNVGIHPYIQQNKHIQICSKQLQTQLQDACERRNKYSSTIKMASLLVGILIIILLI